MEHFIINSSICLFVLWLAYKLLLENTSWHVFKRWFLIASLIVSLCIPFLVVQTIVIPIEATPFAAYDLAIEETIIEKTAFEMNWWYVTLGIYIIGFAIMLWRFGKNLNSFRIQQDDEISSYKTYQLILRKQITIPHSFLKRIFVSKKDHEAGKIPTVVLEHEKAHLDQKHSLDILFIEALIVLLWFNPILYIHRYSIKLNHEFLADQSVLKQGVSTTEYQQTLLDHATTSYEQAMANTFTFPIIKKRFHIMKTHTSHASLVLRSLSLIPILALLIISCGKEETEFIEIEETIIVEDDTNQKLIIVDPNDPKGNITINGEPHTYKIKGDQISIYNKAGELQDFESQGYEVRQAEVIEIIEILESVTQKNIEEYNFQAKKHQEFIEKNGQVVVFKEDTKRMQLIFNSMTEEQRTQNEPWPYLYWDNDLTPGDIPPPPPPAVLQTITSNDVEKYNSWAKQINDTNNKAKKTGSNEYAIVKAKDVKIFKSIYDNMTKAQKSNAQPWPNLPPPPPPAAPNANSSYIKVDGNIYHYTLKENDNNFYDRKGNIIDVYGKTVEYVKKEDLPPPPPPADPLDYIKDKGDQMNYYIDNVKVNAAKAKAFIQKKGKKGIEIGPVDGVYSLKMYTSSDDKRVYIDQNPDNIYGPTRLDRDLKC
ncbi:M56 family metallopeptidase [Nonlabens sp.]|uniref:M56 family metallopeptidase n=1 Tax=Nonlabens sp. TaxID=1888209 RepID=UPI003F69D994